MHLRQFGGDQSHSALHSTSFFSTRRYEPATATMAVVIQMLNATYATNFSARSRLLPAMNCAAILCWLKRFTISRLFSHFHFRLFLYCFACLLLGAVCARSHIDTLGDEDRAIDKYFNL